MGESLLRRLWTAGCLLLLLSAAGSANWEKRPLNTLASFKDVFFLNENRGWIVGGNGVIFSTLDGGKTWAPRDRFTTDDIVQIHFTDADTGWLLCQRNVYSRGKEADLIPAQDNRRRAQLGKGRIRGCGPRTCDSPSFYQTTAPLQHSARAVFFISSSRIASRGKSFTRRSTSCCSTAHYPITHRCDRGCGRDDHVHRGRRHDWDKATLLPNSEAKFNAVYFAGSKLGAWAVGNGGQIFHSNGGARLWRPQNSTVTADLNDVTFTSARDGWAVGESGVIVRTRDGGQTWYDTQSPVNHTLQRIFFVNGHGWAVGFGGTVIYYDPSKTDDPGFRPQMQRRG